ncbi:serine hydrolase domain-containing protein [Flavobacterium sp. '19STA2R22 D10 B1']|uniref:serine hydrolase domain-containing protein n=1 Tax=Flavobacterium aerium TaxID=3037261 RepID=UPI00278C098A|nr:serine hydrolase [Flavobacterium sp. '19STA2R22 D10 B1']
MKTFKRIFLITLTIGLVGLAFLFIKNPYLIKVLRYQSPGIETYKIFPQEMVQPSTTPFHFIKPLVQRNDLDTVLVYNSKHVLVPFSDYLKGNNTKVFMVIRNDTVLYEKYADGFTEKTLAPTFSISKSMLSVMVGIALKDGNIKSLEDKITQYIPELKQNKAFNDITISNLLMMQSGLAYKEIQKSFISDVFSDEGKYYYTDDVKKELLQLQKDTVSGTKWKYKSVDPLLLGWVLEEATGKKIPAYFEEKVWKSIGAEQQASWGMDHENGLTNTASKFQSSAIDLAKIGRLYLNKGNYDSIQILPEDWISKSISIGNAKPLTSKYWQESTQNYLWWIPQQGEKGDYAAEGMGGQILYIDPKTNTIIVQFADRGKPDYPYRKISRYLSQIPFQYPKQ